MQEFSPDKRQLIMTREQVRAVDDWAINTLGIPGVVLMENAGRSCAEFIKDKLAGKASPKVCVFCGTGNNGGDGYVIARHLLNSRFRVAVVICGDADKVKGDAKINLDILKNMGQSVEVLDLARDDIAENLKTFGGDADMLVDAVFGTGLKGDLSGEFQKLIEGINSLRRPILAVDIPSGLDCDTGLVLASAIRADYTITFVAEKAGFKEPSSARYTGRVYVASIGIEPADTTRD